ncbi:hypothetical protein AAZX31_18G096000 [Glycine max]
MSIRTNPMKAIPLVLKRLRATRITTKLDASSAAKLEELMSLLDKKKDLFKTVKSNGDEFLDILTLLDGHLRYLNKDNLDNAKFEKDMEAILQRIKDSAEKLLPKGATNEGETQALGSSSKVRPLDNQMKKLHSDPSSSQNKNELLDHDLYQKIEVSYEELKDSLNICLLSLLVFPEGAVIRKRHTIYWWIGEGFVTSNGEKTAEEVGEGVIDELLKCKMIVAYGNGLNPVVKKFKVNPHICGQLVSFVSREKLQHLGFSFQIISHHEQPSWLVVERQKVNLGDKGHLKSDHWKTIFNLRASYLNFVSQWLAKMKNLAVLQLGRWQDPPFHHIEVASEDFLKELKDQKQLKYLSLRGISRMSQKNYKNRHWLPPSIAQLGNLEILDLKACHNLEALPSDIASMRSLTHLDVSECYLLDSMPKGIEKLTQLQVLKGFVIGNSSKTPCRITDLANLKKLKRLSIHIGSEAVIQEKEFEGLKDLTAVKRYSDIQVIFPSSLEKLELEGFPGFTIPEWLKPSRLPQKLKKLYIKGGKLKSLDHGEICHKWHVEILRLQYLNQLQLEERKLHKLFPSLRYVERTKLSTTASTRFKHNYFLKRIPAVYTEKITN